MLVKISTLYRCKGRSFTNSTRHNDSWCTCDAVPEQSLVLFHILVLQKYWVLTESRIPLYWVLAESRIPLKPVLGGMRIVAISISSHEQTIDKKQCGISLFHTHAHMPFLSQQFNLFYCHSNLHQTLMKK